MLHVQSATEEMIARIFRCFPGMEYCDLKRDRVTGQSKASLSQPTDLQWFWPRQVCMLYQMSKGEALTVGAC